MPTRMSTSRRSRTGTPGPATWVRSSRIFSGGSLIRRRARQARSSLAACSLCSFRCSGHESPLPAGERSRAKRAVEGSDLSEDRNPLTPPLSPAGRGSRPSLLLQPELLRLLVGIDQLAGLVVGRIDHGLGLDPLELGRVVALHISELHLQHARLGPFALGAEAYVAIHGLERVGADIVRELAVVEALGGLDRLLQYLHLRV